MQLVYFIFILIKCIGVTFVHMVLLVSCVHFYDTWSAHRVPCAQHPKSNLVYWTHTTEFKNASLFLVTSLQILWDILNSGSYSLRIQIVVFLPFHNLCFNFSPFLLHRVNLQWSAEWKSGERAFSPHPDILF